MLGFIPGLLPWRGSGSRWSNDITLLIKERIFIYTEKRILKRPGSLVVGENTNKGPLVVGENTNNGVKQ